MKEYSINYCKSLLKKKGVRVNVKKNLFNPAGTARYTLQEAIEYALRGRMQKNTTIAKEQYDLLVRLLLKYKDSGSCKELNMRFFCKDDNQRFTMNEFIDRLADRGWYFLSAKRINNIRNK